MPQLYIGLGIIYNTPVSISVRWSDNQSHVTLNRRCFSVYRWQLVIHQSDTLAFDDPFPSLGPSPLLSEQRESQCLPKTTSILSPCRQTKSVLLGCREWLPLIRRTCCTKGFVKNPTTTAILIRTQEKYLHGMANKTKVRWCVSRTCVIRTSAVQQAVKHPSVLIGPITGPTAEEWMGAVGEENRHQAQESVLSVF